MESESFKKSANSSPIPVYIAPSMGPGDEIGLVELWGVVTRRKLVILASLILSVLLAITYLFFAEPLYKANAYLLPPQQKNIQGLLVEYQGIEDVDEARYTQEIVYKVFLDNLKSQSVRRDYFENHGLIEHYSSPGSSGDINADRVFHELFSKRLNVQIDRRDVAFVTVSFSDRNPELAAQWLNEIIAFANKRTVRQLYNDVNAAIQSEIGQVRYQLDSKLKLAEQRRRDKIKVLKEALNIARALGIKDRGTFPDILDKSHRTGVAVNTAQLPLYTRGADALESEIGILESRKSDEPFISGYRDLQEKRAFLEGISIDVDKLSAFTMDAAARIPYRVEKPRKVLTILVATGLGLVMGIFLVFFLEFMSKARRERSAGLS